MFPCFVFLLIKKKLVKISILQTKEKPFYSINWNYCTKMERIERK